MGRLYLRAAREPFMYGFEELLGKMTRQTFNLSLQHRQVLVVHDILSNLSEVIYYPLVLKQQLVPFCLTRKSISQARGEIGPHNDVRNVSPLVVVRYH